MSLAARSVRVRVSASTANLGPGFDSIGLALGLWDDYVATALDTPGLLVEVTGEGAGEVPTDESHLVVRTMRHTWDSLGVPGPAGLRLLACNGVPHGRGLGSSATAIVAGVVAAQALSYAAELAPGAAVPVDLGVASHIASVLEGHPDNASASVFGGLTLSWMPDGTAADLGDRTVTARPVLHPDVDVVAFVPDQQLATRHARAVLPSSVPLKDAAANSGRAALLVHALTAEPVHLHAATRDWLHQEPRRSAYPESMRLVDALRSQGHAAVISGAGPTVLVLTTRDRMADVVAPAALGSWARLTPGIPAEGASAVVV
ncbi:homoserine kinase [Intrasporangium calvum]|uniref:Homoserine kinase n=1 Tax=Intrasporangium calvum TaxID=53358 RepID=A0ABT5GMC0_9MICO|nr:homoserine kinase [Intrasporangium calvum]MDC5699213.1 homoserine kinase [Intrasporangium calvum]